jgi:transposase
MILDAESWMNIRRFRGLHEAGASYAEIGRECGCDWRTVKKYLAEGGVVLPPAPPPRAGCQPRVITPFVGLIDAWLRADLALKGSVIHERLVDEYGFAGSYQRVKMHLVEARRRVAAELAGVDENRLTGLHRRFEVVPGAQAQVDWGEEGALVTGLAAVFSFHMTLSHSRDPFCCFTTSTDLATFWDCHRRAFAHFGGVPGAIVYDRTKTVVRRHVAPRLAVPLHPEAAAFAGHYGFVIDVLAAYRPMAKGRVERQVAIVRDHVLAGRRFTSLADCDDAFTAWLPSRRASVHRTHRQVIAERAVADRAALTPLPALPYLVAEKHLRRVGKDALVSFQASLYSVPARRVRPGQRVELRVSADTVVISSLAVNGGGLLAAHPRAAVRGSWIVDEAHWAGLPDGRGRATTVEPPGERDSADPAAPPRDPLTALLTRPAGADVAVGRRPLADYVAAAGLEAVRR